MAPEDLLDFFSSVAFEPLKDAAAMLGSLHCKTVVAAMHPNIVADLATKAVIQIIF